MFCRKQTESNYRNRYLGAIPSTFEPVAILLTYNHTSVIPNGSAAVPPQGRRQMNKWTIVKQALKRHRHEPDGVQSLTVSVPAGTFGLFLGCVNDDRRSTTDETLI